jgi:hypothetical protein
MIWARIQRMRPRVLVTPSTIRLLISIVLLVISIPLLYQLFAEPQEPTKRINVSISTDCFNKFNVDQQIAIDSSGDAKILLRIRPEGVITDDCKKLGVSIPGTIVRTYPTPQASEFNAPRGLVRFDLDHLDQIGFFDSDIPISVSGSIPHALGSKTFTKRTFYLEFDGGAVGTINTAKVKAQEPWRTETLIDFDPVYDLSDFNRSLYNFVFNEQNHTIISFVSQNDFTETFFLENGDSANKRELHILCLGVMLGTGFAIFTEFLIGSILMRKRPQ